MSPRKNFDIWALEIAQLTAERSTCRRRKAGAVIVDEDRRIIGIGYNGVPRGVPHCIDVPCPGAEDTPGNSDRCWAIHAEVNAVINCRGPYAIHTVYLTASPCFHCAKVLMNLPNLVRIVYLELYSDIRGMDLIHTHSPIIIDQYVLL